MKTIFLLIAFSISISISLFFIEEKNWLAPEKATVKNVNLEVYKSTDYSSAIYRDASAKICIIITKVSRNSRVTVWSKTFDARQLKQYPLMAEPLSQSVVIKNVFDNKEHLEILSTVCYYTNGSVLEIKNGVLVSRGARSGTLIISI